jgi:hypothetical protein
MRGGLLAAPDEALELLSCTDFATLELVTLAAFNAEEFLLSSRLKNMPTPSTQRSGSRSATARNMRHESIYGRIGTASLSELHTRTSLSNKWDQGVKGLDPLRLTLPEA